ncbi:MAG: OmpA family protein [Planctomycetota bacterium]|nr:OmpA family protein [Planctomycetota bacterium]
MDMDVIRTISIAGLPGSEAKSVQAPRAGRSLLRVAVATLGLASLVLGGCVGQADYDRLYETNRSLREENGRLKAENEDFRVTIDQLRTQLSRCDSALANANQQLAALTGQRDQLMGDLQGLGNRLSGLQLSALDPETDRLLRELADQYPDLIQYDAALGMLRFSADLTFDSGRADVKPSAKPSIDALARILGSPAAAPYEVIVVGHTDSQRISAATARGFPTNVHLSVGRAIAVRNELVSTGVTPGKVQVAGWGEFKPMVPNTPSGNTPQNRRVEIFLTRPRPTSGDMTIGDAGGPVEPIAGEVDRSAPPTRRPDINK